ncbi:MAG: hypothetical protein H6922_00045 [Pseudomonadaceae bacterium]|nr:hypothetical protein [Pseudomonadaceae bacterium]
MRGYTLLAAVVDEACFLGYEADAKISDTELVRALKPSLHNKAAIAVCLYARKCGAINTRHHGNPAGRTLVWNAPSRMMNPTLPQSVVDEALAEDMQAAKSENFKESG